jgi:hypothetical protein
VDGLENFGERLAQLNLDLGQPRTASIGKPEQKPKLNQTTPEVFSWARQKITKRRKQRSG